MALIVQVLYILLYQEVNLNEYMDDTKKKYFIPQQNLYIETFLIVIWIRLDICDLFCVLCNAFVYRLSKYFKFQVIRRGFHKKI